MQGVAVSGDNAMIQLEKSRLNVWNVGGVLIAMVVQSFALGIAYARLDSRIAEGETYRATRAASTDANFVSLNQRLQPFDTALFRLTSLETTVKINNDNVNERIDRIVESLGLKLDNLTETTNGLRTDVKLLSQKVEANTAVKKAALALGDTPNELQASRLPAQPRM